MTPDRRLGGLIAAIAVLACEPVFAAPVCPPSAQTRTGAILPPKVVPQPTVAMIVRPPSVGTDRRVLPLIVPVFSRSTATDPCADGKKPDSAASAEASRRRSTERPKEDASPRPR